MRLVAEYGGLTGLCELLYLVGSGIHEIDISTVLRVNKGGFNFQARSIGVHEPGCVFVFGDLVEE
jgi:hypothetical protein